MPSRKTTSYSPASTTRHPSPAPTAARKPRKIEKDSGAVGRAGSAGGIRLRSRSPARIKMSTPTPPPPTKKTTSTKDAKDTTPAAQAKDGPNRQRRRPRKLNKEPAPTQNTTDTPAQSGEIPTASTAELEALKSRVRGLEAKVEELYQAGEARGGRSPRRRGKGRKGSTKEVPTTTTAKDEPAPVATQEEEEADEELVRLEGELESARQDLASYSLTPHKSCRKKTATVGDDYVEEIPRDGPAVEEMHDTGDRQVTLTGSYRIPLPSSVSMEDVKSIQSGINSASNVAKSFMEQRRAQQAVRDQTQAQPSSSKSQRTQKTQRTPQSTAVQSTSAGEKQSWSEWIGGYSMAITRAVKNIEAEAAIESQRTTTTTSTPRRPAQASRTASAPSTRSTPATKTPKASSGTSKKKGTTGGQRPPLKPTTNNGAKMSSEQVHGLMS